MEQQDSYGRWHHKSGVVLPRGCIVTEHATAEEIERVTARAERRRGPQGVAAPSRPQQDSDWLHETSQWLQLHGLNAMGVVTFSDRYAGSRGIYSPAAAVDDVWRGLTTEIPLRGSYGFWGKFVLAPEWHRTGRQVPHVHLAFETIGNAETLCADLRRYFGNTRGRSRFELMRDVDAATLYGLKDVLKEQRGSVQGFGMRLWKVRKRG